jgi:DNA-binding MarR family transcriptional regulator
MSSEKLVPFATTLYVRDCCLCLHVQRTARALARRFDDALRPLGLTNGQFSLLMALNRPEPASMASIAGLLAIDRTTLTAALKPLKRRELVKIIPDRTDHRSRRLILTPAGESLLASALPTWQQTHQAVEGLLKDVDLDRLRSALLALS